MEVLGNKIEQDFTTVGTSADVADVLLLPLVQFDVKSSTVNCCNCFTISDSQLQQSNNCDDNIKLMASTNKTRQVKNILLWNELPPGRLGSLLLFSVLGDGKGFFSSNRCQINRCKLSVKPMIMINKPLHLYDAIVFNINDLPGITKLVKKIRNIEKITQRRQGQRFVALRSESPMHQIALNSNEWPNLLTGFFNWSMSYRQDADVHLFYGSIRPVKPVETSRNTKTVRGRIMNSQKTGSTAVVAWMVSHCATDSRREDYVKELRKYIDVDVYGKCGELHCKKAVHHQSSSECYDMIESKYKFYLSFENSICADYVTEKFSALRNWTASCRSS